MFRKIMIPSLILLFLIISCHYEKRQSGFEDFDMVWKTVDKYYPFLEFKNIDWEAIKKEYRPKFEKVTYKERIDLLGKLIKELKDGHADLFDEKGNYIASYISPRYKKDKELFDSKVVKSYFSNDITSINEMYDFGITDENIGYIYIHRFPKDKKVYSKIDIIIDSLKTTNGLIIDLRHSGGGHSKASDYIFERLISDTISGVIWTRENGENYPIVSYYPAKHNYQNPIITLINGLSYSVPDNLANLCKKAENITVVGETTGGGGGIPRTFELPSGLKFRIPTRTMLRYDNEQVEWNGIPPDIPIKNSTEDLKKGKDNQLEYALNELK